ncbi:uncharacterized protein A4U43_C03F24570 [Asparagus officinalis]|uniref:Epidermal patterning factor-like protein n=1 Tax=Asparagus officinalis TaxID=4686 RepID=A0A5P1FHU9_ASPOF|nr:EPIDERMAL PATTERNING FACTOR-like protein 2 [Asparagus officinalis]ONK76160.1 uncharacterized protein A4U43_C03F24570 [Asparagus officinalis]
MGVHFLCSTLSVFLLLSSTQVEARQLVEASEVAEEGGEMKMTVEGAMIGSRPPSCERRCISCSHCEAVQVPLAPTKKQGGVQAEDSASATTTFNSRGDEYSSNYKPMNWKCKCGDRILNP